MSTMCPSVSHGDRFLDGPSAPKPPNENSLNLEGSNSVERDLVSTLEARGMREGVQRQLYVAFFVFALGEICPESMFKMKPHFQGVFAIQDIQSFSDDLLRSYE